MPCAAAAICICTKRVKSIGSGRRGGAGPVGGGLCPSVSVAARVLVGVQFVVCTSAQHQLQMERRRHSLMQRTLMGLVEQCDSLLTQLQNNPTPLSVQSTQNTLSSWAARSYRGALQLWHN